MGSGKTAVGRRIAQRLGYAFLDTDHFIEQNFGCSIAELFELKGEPFFREAETRLLEHVPELVNHVVATGGGILAAPGNLEKLRRAGLSIFLNADLEEMLKRLERDTRRPKLREGELRETVESLLAERMPLYAQAEISIDTKGKSVNRVAGELIGFISERIKAHQSPGEGKAEGRAPPPPEGKESPPPQPVTDRPTPTDGLEDGAELPPGDAAAAVEAPPGDAREETEEGAPPAGDGGAGNAQPPAGGADPEEEAP